ncbi:MAG: DUF4280 domain-containing protein [Defluviitaleaceae bacterium]|nr:DUF4280 domain-containing protein [Defluviitaleaceae bacterium]
MPGIIANIMETVAQIIEEEKEEKEENKEIHYPYVVRGAHIFCPYGTHIRKLDMPYAHGAFIRDKAMLNEDDCEVGLSANIAPFGGCRSPLKEGKEVKITIGEDDLPMPTGYDEATGTLILPDPGHVIEDVKLCEPSLLSEKWLEAEEETLVDGKPALTMKCHLTCAYACQDNGEARISFMTDGQAVE